jgi:FkbM family methyltransferase
MSESQIVRDLFRQANLAQWPRLAWYLLGRSVYRQLKLRLFDEMVVRVGPVAFIGSVSGMSGLVFFHQIHFQRIYDHLTWPNGTLFDVGANCGFFTIAACQANPELLAVAFEPHPKTAERMRANLRVNGLTDRTQVVQAAVGEVAGECDIEVSEDSSMAVVAGSGATLTNARGIAVQTRRVHVPVLTLDEFAGSRGAWPELMKVDVEGFEREVLRGATKCLSRAAAAIVECDSDASLAECSQRLQAAGFRVTRRDGILFADRENR